MKCPKCGKRVSKKDTKCPKCGEELDFSEKDGKGFSFGKKDKKDKVIEVKAIEDKQSGDTAAVSLWSRVRTVLIVLAAVLLIVLIVLIVTSFRSKKGERCAESAYDYIGRSVADLNADSEIFYADDSAYAGVNTALAFDFIAESDGSLKAGGVKYPKWAVTLKTGRSGGFISDVTYTDFTVIKDDMRGLKTDGVISLDRFSEGEKKSAVLKAVDIRPYSISCSQTGIILYTYKYRYTLDNGDEQAAILRVGFSEKGDYKYSSTELLIPQYM